MIGHGRLTFNDAGWGEIVGVFSVDATGWVTKWLDSNPEVVDSMYPPTAVAGLGFTTPAPKPQPVVTDAAVRAFAGVLNEHGYDGTELYKLAGLTPVRETVRAALAAAFAEVGL